MINFVQIDDENDVLFHKAFVMLYEIFPEMLSYDRFRNYDVTVAVNDVGECVAFMLLRCPEDLITDSDDVSEKKTMNIASIGVDPEYRRQGIADAYIKWVKNLYPKYSFNLHVSIKNTGAIKLYENNGFVIKKTIRNYYTETNFEPYINEGVDAHLMVCEHM
jgi:ribosomal protein S18 acetylase RimI-like enzyme